MIGRNHAGEVQQTGSSYVAGQQQGLFCMSATPTTTRQILPGDHTVLGANWNGEGTNFAIFSAHAQRVELCLFDDASGEEIERITLPEYTNEIWHGFLPGVGPGTLYGYLLNFILRLSKHLFSLC